MVTKVMSSQNGVVCRCGMPKVARCVPKVARCGVPKVRCGMPKVARNNMSSFSSVKTAGPACRSIQSTA